MFASTKSDKGPPSAVPHTSTNSPEPYPSPSPSTYAETGETSHPQPESTELPLQTPAQSTTAVPPQSPLQSTSKRQLPLQSKPTSG